MDITNASSPTPTNPKSSKPSFHFVPATSTVIEEDACSSPPPSDAHFYLTLGCTALLIIVWAWWQFNRLDARIGRQATPDLLTTRPSAPPHDETPVASAPTSPSAHAGKHGSLLERQSGSLASQEVFSLSDINTRNHQQVKEQPSP
ncbi:MAG: hypothetical protein ACK5TH_21910 [Prosthecobacter sp.]|jgi:hypothetical protein